MRMEWTKLGLIISLSITFIGLCGLGYTIYQGNILTECGEYLYTSIDELSYGNIDSAEEYLDVYDECMERYDKLGIIDTVGGCFSV